MSLGSGNPMTDSFRYMMEMNHPIRGWGSERMALKEEISYLRNKIRDMEYYVHSLRGRRSPPQVEWLGWGADLRDLQRHGWQIAEQVVPRPHHYHYHYQDREVHLRFHHPEVNVVGTSGIRSGHRSRTEPWEFMHLHIAMAHEIRVQTLDSAPRYAAVDVEDISMREDVINGDCTYFRPIEGKDILLKKASMDEILDIALSKQVPEQDRIRQEMKDRERRGQTAARLILTP